MKKMYYFAATLLIMLFAACSNDHIGQDDDDGIVTDPTGEAWISLDIKTTAPKALGRALNNPDKEMGTPAESAVSKLRVIFFDENRNVTADKSFTVGTNSEAGEPGQPEGIFGTAFKVPAASKRILVIANPSVDLPDVGLFNSYDDFNQAIVAVASLSTPSYFMMTNAKGDLEPSQANGDETDLTLYNSASKAESQPLSIHIDRAVAKVRVYTDNGNISSNNLKANISEPGWVLNATNKRYFPVSKRVKTWMEGTSRGCITPFDQYDLGSYRIDPNHDVQPLMSDPGFASYLQEYNYEMNAANIASSAWHPTEISVDNVEYCLENTQTADHNVWAYTTQVLFKVIYSPKGLIDPDKNVYNNPADNVNNGELLPGTDWLMVNGGYYTWNLLMDYIKAELLYKYTSEDKDPTVIYTAALSKTLNSYLKAIGTPEVSTDRGNGTPETRANEVVDNFNQKRSNVENYGAFRHGTVSYYKGGVNYYPIMIKHDDSPTIMNKLGEFGVVRNSVYDITVNKIDNPGYPSIPDPDPITPDEEEDRYLSIKIEVNPWTWYSQVEPL